MNNNNNTNPTTTSTCSTSSPYKRPCNTTTSTNSSSSSSSSNKQLCDRVFGVYALRLLITQFVGEVKIKTTDQLKLMEYFTKVSIKIDTCIDRNSVFQALKNNKTIDHLEFWGNRLNEEESLEVFNSLKQNSTLTHLKLSLEQGWIGLNDLLRTNQSLKLLDLSYNKRTKPLVSLNEGFVESLWNNKGLTEINLSDNGLSDNIGVIIGNGLKNNCSLIKVNLSRNRFGESAGRAIGEALKQNKTIKDIDLGWQELGFGDHVAEGLRVNKSITRINLSCTKLTEKGAEYLGEALKTNTNLTDLDLENNKNVLDGWKHVSERLKINTSLIRINLSFNKFGIEAGKYIGEILKINNTLNDINLEWNQGFNEGGAKFIGEGLSFNKSVKKLKFSFCKLGKGVIHIGKALEVNRTLESIDFHSNNISDEIFKTLCDGLYKCSSLRILSINRNDLSSVSCKSLGDYLSSQFATLVELDLGGNNQVGDDGVLHIAKGLERNTTLKVLGLSKCKLTGKGALYLSQMLKVNQTLICLIVHGNNLGETGTKYISDALIQNTTLRAISLYETKIGEVGAEYLYNAIKQNSTLSFIFLYEEDLGGKCDLWKELKINSVRIEIDFTFPVYEKTVSAIKKYL